MLVNQIISDIDNLIAFEPNQERLNLLIISKNTWMESGDLWIDNIKQNKSLPDGNINHLVDLHEYQDTICLGFGPSLRYNHQTIPRQGFQTICCDRGYYWFRANGFNPLITLAMDARINKKYIGNHSTKNKSLIAHIGANHDFCKEWIRLGGSVYFYSSVDIVGSHKYTDDLWNRETRKINTPGNVGCGMIGVCLELLHSRNIYLWGYDHSFNTYYYPDQTIEGMKWEELFYGEGINGQKTYYDAKMLIYIDMIKMMVEKVHKATNKVFNMSGAGILQFEG